MYSVAFLKGALERAIKTFFQSVAGVAGAGGMGWVDFSIAQILTIGGLAALASFVTSMSNPEFVAGVSKVEPKHIRLVELDTDGLEGIANTLSRRTDLSGRRTT